MSNAITIYGQVNEDGTASMLARLTALEGTGTQQVGDVGKPVKIADLSTITCKVWDLGVGGKGTPTEVTPAPTVVVATAISDTLLTNGWDADSIGYNFRHDLAPAYFPTGEHDYQAEYKFTLTGGGVFWARFRVKAITVYTS